MTGNAITVYDIYVGEYKEVHPRLVYAVADTPARRGWALTTGHTSLSGCDKCGLRSTRELPSGDLVQFSAFAGYRDPAPALKWNLASRVWSA